MTDEQTLLPPQRPNETKPPGTCAAVAIKPPPSPAVFIKQEKEVSLPRSHEVEVFHENIKRMMEEIGAEAAERWDKIKAIDDINELLRTNIYQFQVTLQGQLEECARMRKMCVEAMQAPQNITLQRNDPRGWARVMNAYRNQIRQADQTAMELGRIVKEVSREYREFALSKRSSVHVSQIEKFALAVKAVIHQEIHDPEILRRISIHLSEVFRKLFPASLGGGV